MTPTYKLSGPKGRLIARVKRARLGVVLPGLVRRFKRITVSPAEATGRDRARSIMLLLLKNEPKAHYAQVRPMQTATIKTLAQLAAKLRTSAGVAFDCSESVTLIARLAGFQDPNGRGYDGTGWTGTIISHGVATGREIPVKKALCGDPIVFGGGTGHHVVTVLEPGHDPLVFSHGQERGPLKLRLSEEQKYQPKPARAFRLV